MTIEKLDGLQSGVEMTKKVNEIIDATNASYIGEPIVRLSDTLYSNEIRLEGAEVSKTTYASLYAVYGDAYGTPSKSTNFVLPDFRDKSIWGAVTHGYVEAGLPDHQHYLNVQYSRHGESGGGAVVNWSNGDWDVTYTGNPLSGSASSTNSIYGKSTTVRPPSVKVRFVTRYQ